MAGVDTLSGCSEDRARTTLSGFLWSFAIIISTAGSPLFSVAAALGIARPVPWCGPLIPLAVNDVHRRTLLLTLEDDSV